MKNHFKRVCILALVTCALLACKSTKNANTENSKATNASSNASKPDDKGIIHSGSGNEKEKPAAGKSNVQGRVLFNSQPAPKIDVKLCEKFNQFLGGCQ